MISAFITCLLLVYTHRYSVYMYIWSACVEGRSGRIRLARRGRTLRATAVAWRALQIGAASWNFGRWRML